MRVSLYGFRSSPDDGASIQARFATENRRIGYEGARQPPRAPPANDQTRKARSSCGSPCMGSVARPTTELRFKLGSRPKTGGSAARGLGSPLALPQPMIKRERPEAHAGLPVWVP